jgi:hypothetical protein
VGFISSGTYGRVYKAIGKNGQKGEFAIKKFVFNLNPDLEFLPYAVSGQKLTCKF